MEEADGAFRNVLDGDPDHAPALYNLGLICYQGNKTEDASRFLTRALEQRPEHMETRAILAAVLASGQNLAEALPHARAVSEAGQSDPRCPPYAATYRNESPFDLVIAAAPHGAVLFESQGRRSTTGVEEAFPKKVSAVAAAGFAVEREGQVCDDRVNLLAFAVLRKQT